MFNMQPKSEVVLISTEPLLGRYHILGFRLHIKHINVNLTSIKEAEAREVALYIYTDPLKLQDSVSVSFESPVCIYSSRFVTIDAWHMQRHKMYTYAHSTHNSLVFLYAVFVEGSKFTTYM